jgi:hypothetical protein
MGGGLMTVKRSYNADALRAARGEYVFAADDDAWVANTKNVMYEKGPDVGLATYDYPGLYTVHWFFKSKGKQALVSAAEMLNDLFTNYGAKAVRGVIHMDNKPSRFLAKYVGFEKISVEEFLDGPNELMLLYKDRFYQHKDKIWVPSV